MDEEGHFANGEADSDESSDGYQGSNDSLDTQFSFNDYLYGSEESCSDENRIMGSDDSEAYSVPGDAEEQILTLSIERGENKVEVTETKILLLGQQRIEEEVYCVTMECLGPIVPPTADNHSSNCIDVNVHLQFESEPNANDGPSNEASLTEHKTHCGAGSSGASSESVTVKRSSQTCSDGDTSTTDKDSTSEQEGKRRKTPKEK